jgi:hypothetical protein
MIDDCAAPVPITGTPTLVQSLVTLLPGVVPTTTGIVIPDDLPYDDWLQGTKFVRRCLEANEVERNELLWCWADLMRYGENHYGERAAQAAEIGYAMGTTYNVVWIGGVEFSCRHENYSFWSHAPVANLPPDEQRYWLDKATSESPHWSRTKLTEEIGRAKAKREGRNWEHEKAQEALEVAVDRLNEMPEEAAAEIMETVAAKKAKTAGPQGDPAGRAKRALRRAASLLHELLPDNWGEMIIDDLIWPLGEGLPDNISDVEYWAFVADLKRRLGELEGE